MKSQFKLTEMEFKKCQGSKSRKLYKGVLCGLSSLAVNIHRSTLRTIADVVTATPLCKSVSILDIADVMPRTSATELSNQQTVY